MSILKNRRQAYGKPRLSSSTQNKIPWPLPALLTWGGAWVVFGALASLGAPFWAAVTPAMLLGFVSALFGASPWRRLCIAGGFPLSLAVTGVPVPPWIWLVFLACLILLYPLRTWRDAPLYPTSARALEGLQDIISNPDHILDAGCGLGHGLRELRRIYPQARLTGMEWSWFLRLVCALRCPFARVLRADIWTADWSAFDLVYIFQRPESMEPAAAKAVRELRPGSWLVSLEFEARDLSPTAVLHAPDSKPVWIYQM
jgi:SAM-dependent methyltransferase